MVARKKKRFGWAPLRVDKFSEDGLHGTHRVAGPQR
jgi:hypothetical protein